MSDKIHIFRFPNDVYLMFDLLLLLLLFARYKSLWHHLRANIINRLNDLQLGCNCRYAMCVAICGIAHRLLYLFLYFVCVMYIIMLYQVKAQPVISEILQMLLDRLLTICVDHVFCQKKIYGFSILLLHM